MYVYTYVLCIYTCICMYTHTYIHTCMHACMHTYIHPSIHTYIHTYIHTWYDMIWYDMIWYDMRWYDMIYDIGWWLMVAGPSSYLFGFAGLVLTVSLPFSLQLVAMDGCCFCARVLHCDVSSPACGCVCGTIVDPKVFNQPSTGDTVPFGNST